MKGTTVRAMRFYGWRLCLRGAAAILAATLPLGLGAASTIHVPGDAATIQGGIDLAQAGDDVLVGPGCYYEYDIVLKAGVLVHSEMGPAETLVAPGYAGNAFLCANLAERATIEGFSIRGGHWSAYPHSGGGVSSYSSPLTIRNCDIGDCTGELGGGIYSWFGDLEVDACRVSGCTATIEGGGIAAHGSGFIATITDCEVSRNQSASWGGGILINGGYAMIQRCQVWGNLTANWGGAGLFCRLCPTTTIQDCVVVGNRSAFYYGGAGMIIDSGPGMIERCTVAGNSGTSALLVYQASVAMSRMLVAFNGGAGVGCFEGNIDFGCCDIFGNDGGDDVDCGTDLGGNFQLDPLFCDPVNGDYMLDLNSPCLPGNHPGGFDCGLIGALGEGCGTTAMTPTTWGRIRASFR